MHKINLTILNFEFKTRYGSRLWKGLGVADETNEILLQQRQGKTETIYTWGRGSQVSGIRDEVRQVTHKEGQVT